jgi:NADH-ubiquinone oxidoreductase chain 1
MVNFIYSFLEVLVVIVPILLSVAFITIIERKTMAAIQRRVGPNAVGFYGILQPFADALKLVVKETVVPSQSMKFLFYFSPIITLIFSLIGWVVIPFGPGLVIFDWEFSILYTLAVSSVGIYGILLAGWSANNSYSFLGSIRATSQLVSYELILSSCILCIAIIAGTFNFTTIIEIQSNIWFIVPGIPIFIIFIICILAETSRTPFDLSEAESELTAGFMTEHSAMPFVIFFLAEYCSIVFISSLTAILFIGGYVIPEVFPNNTFINITSIIFAIKTCLILFYFVWIRATLPRLRFTDLLTFCWTGILPIIIAITLLVPSVLVSFDMFVFN